MIVAARLSLHLESAVEKYNLTPLAEIVSYAQAGVAPEIMGLGPVPAVLQALSKAKLSLGDIDLFEFNEAFAGQALGVMSELAKDTGVHVEDLSRRKRKMAVRLH